MSSNEYRKSIAYSKEDREEEIQRLKKEKKELSSIADKINKEIERLTSIEIGIGRILSREHNHDARDVLEYLLQEKREEIKKRRDKLSDVGKKIGETTDRLEELEKKQPINLFRADKLHVDGREAI